MQNLEQLNSAVEQLKKEVWYIAKVSLPNISEELGSLSLADLANLNKNISANTTKITSLQSSVSALQTSLNGISNQLSTLGQKVDGMVGGFGERYDLLYDKDSADANINMGKPNGLVGGDAFDFTVNKYKRIRIYAVLYNNDAVATAYMDTRKYADLTLMTSSLLLNKLYYLRVTITLDGNRLVVNQAGVYEINTSTNTVTLTREKGNANYYVYRVEGLY